MGLDAGRDPQPARCAGRQGRRCDQLHLSYIDPSSLYRYHHTASFSPANWNWGHFTNPKIDELLAKAQETFVPTERDNILASAHELIVDEAPWVWIVHDLNPRAMSPKVKGFVQAQGWVQDLTPVYVAD